MLIAVVAHFVAAALLLPIGRRWGRGAFALGAVVPAATLVYVLVGRPAAETWSWAPGIGLELTFRLDSLSLLMTVLVSGVGALVLCYYVAYAGRTADRGAVGRDAALLVLFAGAMLGLILTDDVLSLYIFWELTTVCSFLLVGGDGATKAVRKAATQALLVTTFGGLAMLLGLILLATSAGTWRISEILDTPPDGPVVAVAVVLVLLGAFTKSAQVPFHPWLPAAMVAPTPVSAYLHAAAMVKAGVYLIARFAPGFADLAAWWVPVLVIGLWTMVLGGWRAMREHDLKRLLAFGTISQLGFLTVLAGAGTHVAALAAVAMLLAHGLFKSALFLTVGAIDEHAGIRDIRELSGLGRSWPALAGFAVLAAASMAGVPPLLGFVGKEAALEAFAHGGVRNTAVLVGLCVGSVLTVAYSLRFLIGAFGSRRLAHPRPELPRPGPGFVVPVALPALAGLVFGIAPGLIEPPAATYAEVYQATEPYHLALWHGWSLPLLLSVVILVAGFALFRSNATARYSSPLPEFLDAQRGYQATVGGLTRFAQELTGRTQVGSLPAYLGVILLTVVIVPGIGLFTRPLWVPQLRGWDSWLQLPLTALVLLAAATVVLARRRFTAVLLTGLIGYGIGALFVVDGGADLALAQFLVESLTLVVFVLVLRRFPPEFVQGRAPDWRQRWVKATVAAAGGIFVACAAVLFSAGHQGGRGTGASAEASAEYIARAEQEAGATNVVNSILVDFRAFDTVGEIVVLAVAATGAASLVLASRRARRGGVPPDSDDGGEENDETREEART
jgi:multicomponent Na+:H+ antiporter subunit A